MVAGQWDFGQGGGVEVEVRPRMCSVGGESHLSTAESNP